MINPLAETMTVPKDNYKALVARYCRRMEADTNKDSPRSQELRDQIVALTDRAKDAGVQLDDESIKTSPVAAEIRTALDAILPEFQSLALALQKRIAMTKHLRERMEKVLDVEGDVQMTTGEAMVLLNLAEPAFEEKAA